MVSKFLLIHVWRFRGSLPLGMDNHGLGVKIRGTAILSGALEAVETGETINGRKLLYIRACERTFHLVSIRLKEFSSMKFAHVPSDKALLTNMGYSTSILYACETLTLNLTLNF